VSPAGKRERRLTALNPYLKMTKGLGKNGRTAREEENYRQSHQKEKESYQT